MANSGGHRAERNRTEERRTLTPDQPTPPPTALGDYLRQQAEHQRRLAAAKQRDPRHLRSAQSLEDLADTADRDVRDNGFYARNLLRHFDANGFAWPDGRAARAIADVGYLAPVADADHEELIAELCSLVTLDVCAHISQHEAEIDRGDVPALAKRYGVGLDRIHNALDKMRYPRLYQVGIPHWHDLTAEVRAALERLDGVWVESASAVNRHRQTEAERPTHVNNVGAATEDEARLRVAGVARIDPDALGLRVHPRILPPAGANGLA